MANVEHSTLTTSNLHENKGVSTATDNTVATAVSGATVWAKLTASNLTGTGNSFGAQLFFVRDEKTSGTNGGTFTSGSFQTRTLNTTVTNEIASASLASNQISLPAGTYFISARAPAYGNGGAHKAKLRNVTDSTDTIIGSNAINGVAAASGASSSDSIVQGRFTIAGTKTFELQHRTTSTQSTNGFGAACSFSVNEVYAEVLIWKVA